MSRQPNIFGLRSLLLAAMATASPALLRAQAAPPPVSSLVDSLFQPVNTSTLTGCAVSLYSNGVPVFERGYGLANLETRTAIDAVAHFQIGSESKQFTALAVHLLAEEGKLSLDDDVHEYVPELPSFDAKITLRQMLSHTSGLRDFYETLSLANARDTVHTDAFIMSWVVRQRTLNFAPGSSFMYSNTNYWLLAKVIERVSGQPFAAFTRTRVFEPLGMFDTFFPEHPDRIIIRRAHTYTRDAGGELRNRKQVGTLAGSTGAFSTTRDLTNWDRAFFDPPAVLASAMRALTAPARLSDGTAIEYASGVRPMSYRGVPVLWHGGADEGYVAHIFHFPQQRFGGAILCNTERFEPWQASNTIADRFLAASLGPPEPVAGTRVEADSILRSIAGLYHTPGGQATDFVYRDGKVMLFGIPRFALRSLTGLRFQVGEIPVYATFIPFDGTYKVRMDVLGLMPVIQLRTERAAPTPADLASLVGTYANADLQQRYVFTIKDGRLNVANLRGESDALLPTYKDGFHSPATGRHIAFERDRAGRVVALHVVTETGRSAPVRFERRR